MKKPLLSSHRFRLHSNGSKENICTSYFRVWGISVYCTNIWGHGLWEEDWPETELLLAKQQYNIWSQLPSSAAGFDLWWCLPARRLLQLVIWLKALAVEQCFIFSMKLKHNPCFFFALFMFCLPKSWWCVSSYVTLLAPFSHSQQWCHPCVSISHPLFFFFCSPAGLGLFSLHISQTFLNAAMMRSPLFTCATFLTSAGDRCVG